MQAEERYGYNGFVYIGGGKYEAREGVVPPSNPPTYGAINHQ